MGGFGTINGSGGNDLLEAGEGGGYVHGDSGDDHIIGGNGTTGTSIQTNDKTVIIWLDEILYGDESNDLIEGNGGRDYLYCGSGNDTLNGGDGDDYLSDYEGQNTYDGGAGNDLIKVYHWSSTGNQIASGGLGTDTYQIQGGIYNANEFAVTDFAVGAGGDLIDIDDLMASSASGGFYSGGNPFAAAQGFLQLVQSGADALLQYDGNGVTGGAVWQTVLMLKNTQATQVTADNIKGNIPPFGSTAGDDVLNGSVGSDTIFGMGGNDTLSGGVGNDFLNGGAGADTAIFSGDLADYRLTVTASQVTLQDMNTANGDDGTDTLSEIETLAFTDGFLSLAAPLKGWVGSADDLGATATENGATVTLLATNLFANDAQLNVGVAKSITAASSANGASVTLLGGNIAYTPRGAAIEALAVGQGLSDTVRYTISDTNDTVSEATAIVRISGINDAPLAVADSTNIKSNVTSTSINVLANDTDVDVGDSKTLVALSNGSGTPNVTTKGIAISIANGQVTYNPETHFAGLQPGQTSTDSFTYIMQDGGGVQSAATVSITIVFPNNTPTAVADTATTTENSIASIAVLNNDTDPDSGDSKTLVSVTDSAKGAHVTVTGSTASYDPGSVFQNLNVGQTGTDTFSYTMKDSGNLTSSAIVTVTVTGVNDAPITKNDTLALSEDNILTVTGSLLTNDTDPDNGDLISLVSVNNLAVHIGQPIAGQYGSLTVKTDGSYTYQLNNTLAAVQSLKTGQSLTETFGYTIKDLAGLQASANINISIAGQNDAPVAHSDGYTYVKGSGDLVIHSADLLLNDSHPDTGGTLSFSNIGSAASGATLSFDPATGIISYNPVSLFDSLKAGQKSSDSFTYTLTDANGITATGTVNLTVIGTNLATGTAPAATGGAGTDVLVGGADGSLTGGKGNDTYIIDQASQTVHENPNEGTDTVITTLSSYSLGDNVENLSYTGLNDFTGIGNSLNNSIEGNTGNDNLSGGAGNDTLKGNAGNDSLDGGTGADSLCGGAGDDVYLIDNSGDKAIEKDPQGNDTGGIDTIRTNLDSYTLAPNNNIENLERLDLTLSSAFIATGNSGNNTITGGAGDDTLNGGTGNDTLNGSLGNDLLNGGDGNDSLNGGDGSDTLSGGLGDNLLNGGSAADLGSDTAVFNDNKSAYNIQLLSGNIIQLSRTVNGVTYTDKLSNIETLSFADGSYAVAQPADPINNSQWLLYNVASYRDDILDGGNDPDTLYAGADNDTVSGNGGADSLYGEAGNDTLYGGIGDDLLFGGAGNDNLVGGLGSDHMEGGAGNDTYVVDSAAQTDPDPALAITGDSITELAGAAGGIDTVYTSLSRYTLSDSVEYLLYTGTGNFTGTGNALANLLTGNTGNDTLDGGLGADLITGGLGDDTYSVDHISDKVIEKAGEGTDLIKTSLANYSLSTAALAEVENLGYLGNNGVIGNFTGTGNALNNLLTGNTGNDTLTGGAGNDTLIGGDGNDKLLGGNDDDTLNSGAGNDTVDGGLGNDTLVLSGNRIDYVFSRPTASQVKISRIDGSGTGNSEFDLISNVEIVQFADGSTGKLDLTDLLKNTASSFDDSYTGGNSADSFDGLVGNDTINGGGGNDTLNGGAGNDTLDGGTGDDTLIGGKDNDSYVVDAVGDIVTENGNEGTDRVRTSLVSYTLGDNLENLDYIGTPQPVLDGQGNAGTETQIKQLNFTSTGNSLDNIIKGGDGNDVLDGGDGKDTLIGGAGNDTYLINNSGDKAVEKDAQGNDTGGIDTVQSSITYSLKDNLENLTLTGSANINGAGNQLDNSLTGNDGDNSLKGNDGADNLDGGAGNDKLDGGTGSDSLLGGLGDDLLIYDSADSKIDGGIGADLLKIGGSGITLDLSQLTFGTIANIEKLDLTGTGNNSLIVNETSLANLTGPDGHDLYVTGNAGDSVTINTKTGALWEDAGISNINGVNYHQYIHITGAVTEHLYVLGTLAQIQV